MYGMHELTLAAVFLAGLAGGVHCAAMCGPLVSIVSGPRPESPNRWQGLAHALAYNAGRISREELGAIESYACPGAGACGGQFTANTMATVFEMMGISPMGYNDVPAADPRKAEVAFETGKLVMDLLRKAVLPRQIMTRKAFLNGIAGAMATGGSTNVVLHLLAVAREAGVRLSIDDFDRVSRKTPRGALPTGVRTAATM